MILSSSSGITSRRSTIRLGVGNPWYNAPAFADLAAVADLNNDRYAITVVSLAGVPAATDAELCVKRGCSFAEWFAFTCASTTARTYIDSVGVMQNNLAVDQPRFDWTYAKRQLALSGPITNLFLNSAVGVTQNVTVAAVANTLSFTGTGSVTLTGASTAGPLVGTGASNRVQLTFTPTAGSLTLTVAGDVRLVQLEAQDIASAYIPTAVSAVARLIESARMSPTIEAIMQRSAASIVARGQNSLRGSGRLTGAATTYSLLRSNFSRTQMASESAAGALLSGVGPALSAAWGGATGFDGAGRSVVRNGGTLATDALAVSSRSEMYIGRDTSNTSYGDGWYDFVGIAPSRLSDARLTALAVVA